MTYRITFPKPLINPVDEYPWFKNSYESIDDWELNDVDIVDLEYEQKFGLKLIYIIPEDNGVKPIVAIEFPSEADATLFMLRWS